MAVELSFNLDSAVQYFENLLTQPLKDALNSKLYFTQQYHSLIQEIALDLSFMRSGVSSLRREKEKREKEKHKTWSPASRKSLLTRLSELLLREKNTLEICARLKPIILHLLYKGADLVKENQSLHQSFCVALSKVVLLYPHTVAFTVDYLQSNPPFFSVSRRECDEPTKKRPRKERKNVVCDLELCKAVYLLLLSDTESFRTVYDWSPLTQYLQVDKPDTTWYAVQSMCLVNQVTGVDKQSLLDKYFSKTQQSRLVIQLLNLERNLRSCLHLNPSDDNKAQIITDSECGSCVITKADLHPALTSICGILLPRLQTGSTHNQGTRDLQSLVVPVPSTVSALQNVAMAVSSSEPVIVSGHIGAGKTSLIEYLAYLTGRHNKLIKVQLGEQIDSKALLGTYCCTETPGKFVWRPGPLTTAVQNGQWLLLEDIDIAPMDVISSLLPLIETGRLPTTNQGSTTRASAGFQLFMTKRLQTAGGISAHSHCTLLEKSVTTVTIQPLSRTELTTVINTLHPNLSKVVDRLLDMYFTLSAGKHADDRADVADTEMIRLTNFYGSRKLSTRDLLRWCKRISDDFQLISSDNEIAVFQEALDCFCDSLPKPSQRLKLAEAIGTKINVSADKSQYYCNIHKPSIDISKDNMKIGRTNLDRKLISAADSLNRDTNSRFAFTRQSSALLEKIAVCVNHEEPVLLVGETGTGKTSVVQYIAEQTGRTLRVINMNQQSDSSDLLGGYKPVVISRIILPLRQEFETLFCRTFSRKQNQTFLSHIQQCYSSKRWSDLLKLIEHTVKAALSKPLHAEEWKKLSHQLTTVKTQVKYAENALAFSFVEGALVSALKAGEWVLLDEINLATAETLDCLCGLLDTSAGSVTLIERGDTEPVVRHPQFRLFACMNPATDVGKKDLPAGVRSRFTEFFVDELENKQDLRVLVSAYLSGLSLEAKQIDGIVNFYLAIKNEAMMRLTDGTGKRPTYSLRTLCRALRYAATNPYQAVQRSLYEAFSMSFLTQLDRSSHPQVTKLIVNHIIGKAKAKPILSKPLLPPVDTESEKFEGYWLKSGDNKPMRDENYILTDTVKANMKDVARVVACGRHPILLQGETSVGKTSMIEYIAAASGNKCVRINNHEHTDVQEYTGSYVADEQGHLVFKEGILVDAMRNGYWIILDELNLAPTDVLEALNRLLDDNRELFIAETQQTVKAHPRFLLFATQNPPGLYGGRKMLSRAFRNRFVELHFDEIPNSELEYILHKRCALPMSSSKKIIKVMSELQLRRRDSGLFAGKQGYITLRDVFRWGERYRQASAQITDTFYDWDQLLADQGFMLLAGRVRKPQEEQVIAEILSKHFKRSVSHVELFSIKSKYGQEALQQIKEEDVSGQFSHIVWTYSLIRLSVLVGQCMKYNEPVLMVGDTGCGKTTICQYFAHIYQRELFTVNCHMHTEGSHFLGGLRPVRHSADQMDESDEDTSAGGRLFEWQDGPLVISMRSGGVLLIDEISLADDSVLERLNSVLEPSRTLVLAEKGGDLETIKAESGFRIVATMNPAGDYGKKELSPALRNRFTEIWCPQTQDLNDYKLIIEHNIALGLRLSDSLQYGDAIVQFIQWFQNQDFGKRFTISVRDVLAWVNFVNKCSDVDDSYKYSAQVYIHGACLVFLDALGSASIADSHSAREGCLSFLHRQVNLRGDDTQLMDVRQCDVETTDNKFIIKPFSIPLGSTNRKLTNYSLRAPSTSMNCLRLLRGLQLHKPILLEGSPGVGKTSLVTALAKASGHHIVRINLSEQTDIADLFGADLPVDGGKGGQFSWRDGLFLQALKSGHWIVLDELNLASQSVLEGLNACFDHRAEVYVPELGKTFHIQHDRVKIFACQNPLKQGGGRKGLPQSFLNRFTQVYVDEMETDDQEFITKSMYPDITDQLIKHMVLICKNMCESRLPGEYNLRDIFRWCELIIKYQLKESYNLWEHFSLLFIQPLSSSPALCEKAYTILEEITGCSARKDGDTVRQFLLTDSHVLVGNLLMERKSYQPLSHTQSCILHKQLASLEYLATCMNIGWMAILDGAESSGKSTLAHMLSQMVGEELKVFSMNSAMDTTDLLGGFEQADLTRSSDKLCDDVISRLVCYLGELMTKSPSAGSTLMSLIHKIQNTDNHSDKLDTLSNLLNTAANENLASKQLMEGWRTALTRLQEKITSQLQSTNGSFEWHDSVLVEAVTNGYWLLIENAHICSASVLDRLNSLLEPNGSLTITERGVIDGQAVTITPHKNFRLILTTNSQQKEISRAMKNRGVVISTQQFTQQESQSEDSCMDNEKLFSLAGVSSDLASILRTEHTQIVSSGDVTHHMTSSASQQIMYERSRLLMSYIRRGFTLQQSLEASRRLYLYYTQNNLDKLNTSHHAADHDIPNDTWTTAMHCLMPNLAQLDQLCIDLKSASTRCSNVTESMLCTVLMERLSIDMMRLLDCDLSSLNQLIREKERVLHTRDKSQPILDKILSTNSEIGGSLNNLPLDLRWISDIWCKIPNNEIKQRLSYLLNVWNSILVCRQLQSDMQNLAANSWCSLSDRVYQGTLDTKHLPHRVAIFYRQISDSFSDLILSMCETELSTPAHSEILQLVELVRRFLSSNSLISATLAWSWLEPAINKILSFFSHEDLSAVVARIDTLLSDHNTESHLYNLVWNSFPHISPINCQIGDQKAGDKSQLGILLQKVLDSLDVYNKAQTPERKALISGLCNFDMDQLVRTLLRCHHVLHSSDSNTGEAVAESMVDLTRLLQLDSGADSQSSTFWSLHEFWYLRSLLHLLSQGQPQGQRGHETAALLEKVSTYSQTPALVQLAMSIYRLITMGPMSVDIQLEVTSTYLYSMIKCSAMRRGSPFSAHHLTDTSVVPSYSSTSLFLITSSLLSDNLTPAIYSADAGTVPSTHNINPTVCLGKYKAKLSQLNNIKQEIWRHSALMLPEKNCCEEEALQAHYVSIILDSEYIPVELKSHSMIRPAIEGITSMSADDTGLEIACKWVWLGYIQSVASAPRGLLDPVVKGITELHFVTDQIQRVEAELSLRIILIKTQCNVELSSHSHPYYKYLQSRLSQLQVRQRELNESSVNRPQNEQFLALVSDARGLLSNTLHYDNLKSLVSGLMSRDAHHKMLAREQLIQATLDSYIHKITNIYPLYADCFQPHTNGIKIVCYGLKRLAHLTSSLSHHADSVELMRTLCDMMSSPAQFYTTTESCEEGLEVVERVCQTARLPAERNNHIQTQYLRLVLTGVSNHAYSSARLDQTLLSRLTSLIVHYLEAWKSDNERRAEKEKERESLYSFKQHGEEAESDEQLLDKITKLNFPSYHKEFSDLIQADTLGDSIEEEKPDSQKVDHAVISVNDKDMQAISDIHCNIMLLLAHTEWYSYEDKSNLHTERMRSHTILLNILQQVISNMPDCESTATSLASQLAHLQLISAGMMRGQCQGQSISLSDHDRDSLYDIYKDENVSEAVRCLECLSVVKLRISELLEDWTDHPLLMQIMSVVERIESFQVTDPLMKYTAGLELVLEKLQEWETNAARYVSVQAAMNSVSSMVIEWRKLELDGWKQSLNNVAQKIRLNSTKYWFHMCSVLLPLICDDETSADTTSAEISNIVIQFIESSSMGDFHYRLRIIKAFTVHISFVKGDQHDTVVNTLYSIWQFYAQFESSVEAYVAKNRDGIEKELKNFVKISRWNDMNYWSVRASVDKAHKTLSKHMKVYHDMLVGPACKLFTEDITEIPPLSEASEDSTAVLSSVLVTLSNADAILLSDVESGTLECLPKLVHLSKKYRSACEVITDKLRYQSQVNKNIDNLSVQIIETVTELQALKIITGDDDADKEKMRKQARNIDMRKRKSLAMLLQTLHKLGLSYRKGCLKLQNIEDRNAVLCSSATPPLNLELVLSDHSHTTGSQSAVWISVWKSSLKYMLRSITRRSVFLNASDKPSKELGPDIIQKLKGYSEHMLSLLRQHECQLTSQTIQFSRLREQVLAIQRLTGDQSNKQVPSSDVIYRIVSEMSETLPDIVEHIEEFKMLLQSVPNTDSTPVPSPCTDDMLTPVSNITMYSAQWQSHMTSTNDGLTLLHKASTVMSRLANRAVKLYCESDLTIVRQHLSQLTECVTSLLEVTEKFRTSDGRIVLVLTLVNALTEFNQKLNDSGQLLTAASQSICDSLSTHDFLTQTDILVRDVLLATQHTISSLDQVQQLPESDDRDDGLEIADDQLSSTLKLYHNITQSSALSKIHSSLDTLISDITRDADSESRQRKVRVLGDCMTILHNYTYTTQYMLSQYWCTLRTSLKLLSILYNIFTHLASKGFCLPEELSNEMDGEGEGNFNTSEGAGLADGQGAKDVSDQIENEDDLDDAKRPEDREKEEKNDEPEAAPAEEKNAIEMSDDFDGTAEDAPTTEVDEDDDNASSGDEDEMDEQMGDIGNSDLRDKLDDKLWGDDDKDENEEEKKETEEEVGKGSDETQQEMVAKDENPEERADNSDQNKTDKDTEEQEKDLNELDKEGEKEGDEFNKEEKPDPYFDGDKDEDKAAEAENDFDLPDNLDLDNTEDGKGEDEGQEEAEPVEIGQEEEADEDGGEGKEEPGAEDDDVDDKEPGDDEGDNPQLGEPDEDETTPSQDDTEQDQQTNVESYGATSQTDDQQIIEQAAQDKGGETESKEEQGAGQSESTDQKEAGLGESYQTGSAQDSQQNQQKHSENDTSQKSDENRVLGDTREQLSMDLETIQSTNQDKQAPSKQNREQKQPTSTLYEHISPDQAETAEAQTMDAANEEQLNDQQKADEMETDADMKLEDEQTDRKEIEKAETLKPREASESNKLSKDKKSTDEAMEVEGEEEKTPEDRAADDKIDVTEGHGNTESTIHTSLELLHLSQQEVSEMKADLEQRLGEWSQIASEYEISEGEARQAWEKYDTVTRTLSHELCEQLRLILEPTQASKLRGDYRTGKRLNMRKVIAYIASQFRKDKIWLRRTEPSKREYQVALAVDDSSSMVDNHSKQLAFEALACISNALTYLQAGELSIASFGEEVKMVHDFSSRFSYDDGASVLRNFTFSQKKTRIAHMLNTMTNKFLAMRRSGSTAKHELAQLLMIVSDGRGLFLEGVETVKQAVRHAMNSGVFLVFVIIDNPDSKDSILDIKMPVFSASGPPEIKSYMDSFPFPFYVILRDINSLPNTLGDALRQWFELVTSQS